MSQLSYLWSGSFSWFRQGRRDFHFCTPNPTVFFFFLVACSFGAYWTFLPLVILSLLDKLSMEEWTLLIGSWERCFLWWVKFLRRLMPWLTSYPWKIAHCWSVSEKDAFFGGPFCCILCGGRGRLGSYPLDLFICSCSWNYFFDVLDCS